MRSESLGRLSRGPSATNYAVLSLLPRQSRPGMRAPSPTLTPDAGATVMYQRERQQLHAAATTPALRDALQPAQFAHPLYERAALLMHSHAADPVSALPSDDSELAHLLALLLST